MQPPFSDAISTNEEAFILRALEKGVRLDGRRLLEVRPVAIEFGAVAGTCEVRLGQTKLIATATAELIEPYPDRPAEGALQFFVEFSPMASPNFEAGRPAASLVSEVSRVVERGLRESRAVDTESLCIVGGVKVWSLRVDCHVLDHGGNLIDAAALASIAALLNYRRPDVTVGGEGEITVHPLSEREPVPLSIHHVRPAPIHPN